MKSLKRITCFVLVFMLTLSLAATGAYATDELLTFELLSDTHIDGTTHVETLKKGLQSLSPEASAIDAIVVAGDISNDGAEENVKTFYETLISASPVANFVIASGNHDMGQMTPSSVCRPIQIRLRKQYVGIDSEKIYYSKEIKGFKFIVLGDEGRNNKNICTISDEQIEFLRQELAAGSVGGRPVFVVCHWPIKGGHGSTLLWPIIPGGSLNASTTNKIAEVMSPYKNAFYLSGHLHEGLNLPFMTFLSRLFNINCVEDRKGIHCVNSPSFCKTNRFGLKATSTCMEFKVYGDKVVIQGRNLETGEKYSNYLYNVPLVNFTAANQNQSEAA